MMWVVIALLPTTGFGIYNFGLKALIIILLSVASAVLAEFVYEKALKKPITIGDFSAVVTGLLLALNLPSTVPWWIPVLGSIFAIIMVKQIFGGLGQNFANPAIVGRIALFIGFATQMSTWAITPRMSSAIVNAAGADAVS